MAKSKIRKALESPRFWMYWFIIITTWTLFWVGGKILVDNTQTLNFGKYALFAAIVVGLFRWLILEFYWRKMRK